MADIPLSAEPWTPSIGWVYRFGDISNSYDEPGEGVWTVPPGVESISWLLFGAIGFGAGTPITDRMPTVHGVNWPVSPGDEIRLGSGAPADLGAARRNGNHPWSGGDGTYFGFSLKRAFSGGGASVLTIGGSVVAVGGGGGGWFVDLDSSTYTPPGGGSAGLGPGGAGGWGSAFITPPNGRASGGGGGAGPGAGGAPEGHGEDGGSIIPASDGGGPTSPTWAELGLDPDDSSTWVPQLSLVALWYFIPETPSGGVGWSLGRLTY